MQQMTRQLAQIETYNKKLYLEGTVSWCSIQNTFSRSFQQNPKSLCMPFMAHTFSVQRLFHLHQCNLIFSLSNVQHISFSLAMGFPSLTQALLRVHLERELTYSNLLGVFFWCRSCSLLSVSEDSPWAPSCMPGNTADIPELVPWNDGFCALPSYSYNFLTVFILCFILPGKVLALF